ncbi:glycosyltransferase [Sphingobacterium multivorum]|uniref:glycosyltransferase n=1 Tax=Sphingobacterium multivorum TaxID=28454 RepID=UPI00345EC5E5
MRILHIINNLAFGGAESLLVSMLPLVNVTHQVEVLLLDGRESTLLAKLESYNIKVIKLTNRGLYNPFIIFKLISIFNNYDIVHVHLFPSMYYAAMAKLLSRSKVKLVFTEHSTNNLRLKYWLFRLVDRFIYLNYTKIICITPEVKKVLMNLGIKDKKLCVIYNGIEVEKFIAAEGYERSSFGYSGDDILLIMVAAFRREKNHSVVVKSLSKLGPRYKLILVGDGTLRNNVELEVKELDLVDRVKFLGVRNDVHRLFKMCNIGILSSHWEGFGLAAVEAMASGLPVVASDVPGLAEIVGGGGLLFKEGDITDLTEKIVSLDDKNYYADIQRSGIKKSKSYDLITTVEQLLQVYDALYQKT